MASTQTRTARPVFICVLFYSMHGHTYKMAEAVAEGVKSMDGCLPMLLRVPELVPEKCLESITKNSTVNMEKIPIATPAMLEDCDGIIVGTPTRFGNMCAQMRFFWDRTGSAWTRDALANKVASVFVTSSTQHGGLESTALSVYNTFAHHGMIIVPMGYTMSEMSTTNEIFGGTPYGAGSISSPDGHRDPTPAELNVAKAQGKRVAEIAMLLRQGRAHIGM